MHPLVRKLYKEALFVGKDYPLGLDYVRREWKKAIRNPENCPSCYHYFDRQTNTKTSTNTNTNTNESKRGDNSDADGDADATTTTTTREEKDANSSSSNSSSTSIRCAIPRAMHSDEHPNPDCERELRKAVGKGRYMIREMIGVIQLKKYRSLKQRYNNNNNNDRELQNYNYNYNHTAAAAATAAATNNHGAVVVRVQKPPSELDPHNEDETPVNPGQNRT